MKRKKRILVAALHWGLGHATRCMPLIDALIEEGAEPLLAADGAALRLWKAEYPQLQHIALPAYNIHYGSSNMLWNMFWQLPRIWRSLQLERKALERIVVQYEIDALLSDSRFGLWMPSLPSVFISHQLHIRLPKLLQSWVNALNQRYILRHDSCWVPDFAGPRNLAAELSHPPLSNVRYIGPLSRFQPLRLKQRFELIVILSGPEPQRSKLERLLLKQLHDFKGSVCFVRGKLQKEELRLLPSHIEVYNYCTAKQLNQLICSSRFVICRSGYSTLMDLAVLGKAALLIPTPGQTEQEYLAHRAAALGQHVQQTQRKINLKIALQQLPHCEPLRIARTEMRECIRAWLAHLTKEELNHS